jgi:hypothetical protein
MNQAARNTHQFSIVPPKANSEEQASDSSASLKEFFSGWLDSVAPDLSAPRPNKAQTSGYRQRPITTTEIVRVNRATVRESTDHRHWPADVVAQFLTAEVITRKNKRR